MNEMQNRSIQRGIQSEATERAGLIPGAGTGAKPPSGRWITWSGLIYVVVWAVGLFLAPPSPAPAAPVEQVSAYYLAHQSATMLQVFLLHGLAGACLLLFGAVLKNFFLRFEGENRTLGDILLGASVAAASVSFVQAALGEVLIKEVAASSDLAVVQALVDLINNADTFKFLALSLFFGAAALLAFRTRALHRWIGWVGAALSPALAISGLGFVLNISGLYATLAVILAAMLVWFTAASVVILRRAH